MLTLFELLEPIYFLAQRRIWRAHSQTQRVGRGALLTELRQVNVRCLICIHKRTSCGTIDQ